jgi:type IV pilus assembly protein PilA
MTLAKTTQGRYSKLYIRGFSLVELLIVIAIIMTIAAIAMPNLLRARRSANEASAVTSLRAIGTAEMMYRASHGVYSDMTGLRTDRAIDETLASGRKSGYIFGVLPGEDRASQFSVIAQPQITEGLTATGVRHYFMDESLVIRYRVGQPASASDPALND